MHEYESHFYVENATFMILKQSRVNPMPRQAFREFLVLPVLISTLNVHKSVGLSHAKCKIICSLTMSLMMSSAVDHGILSGETPEAN